MILALIESKAQATVKHRHVHAFRHMDQDVGPSIYDRLRPDELADIPAPSTKVPCIRH